MIFAFKIGFVVLYITSKLAKSVSSASIVPMKSLFFDKSSKPSGKISTLVDLISPSPLLIISKETFPSFPTIGISLVSTVKSSSVFALTLNPKLPVFSNSSFSSSSKYVTR